jgi:hypothetical protein
MKITGIEIYHRLASCNVADSQRHLSSLMGMNPSYIAQLGSKPLSHRALKNLFQYLWAHHHWLLALWIARISLWEGMTRE